MTILLLGRDKAAVIDYSLPVPVSCWDAPLTANVITTIDVPENYNRAFFSYSPGTNVWVTCNGTSPVVPSVSAASTQELNPSIRQLKNDGSQQIKLISDTASFVNIRFDQGQ